MATPKPPIVYEVKTAAELAAKVNDDLQHFIADLPGLFKFEVHVKKSFRTADGKLHRGDFAILQAYTKTKRSVRTLFDEYNIGTIPPNLTGPFEVAGQTIAAQLTTALNAAYSNYIPSPGTTPTPTPTPAPAPSPAPAPAPSPAPNSGVGATYPVFTAPAPGNTWYLSSWSVSSSGVWLNQPTISYKGVNYLVETPQQGVAMLQQLLNFGMTGSLQVFIDQFKGIYKYFPNAPTPVPAGSPAPAPSPTPSPTPSPAPSPAPAPSPTPTGKPLLPSNFFIQNSPYKYPNNPTIYIYYNGQMHGVVTPQAFARYFGVTYVNGMDLNQIRFILPIPDLSTYQVPTDLFSGSLIQ